MAVIYSAINTVNGKRYVGQTRITLGHRKSCHKHEAVVRHSTAPLARAIRKYGWETFQWEVLEVCEPEALNGREVHWIAKLQTLLPQGYNAEAGGSLDKQISESLREERRQYGRSDRNVAHLRILAADMKGRVRPDLAERNRAPVLAVCIESGVTIEFPDQKSAAEYAECSANQVSRCVRGVRQSVPGRAGRWRFIRSSSK